MAFMEKWLKRPSVSDTGQTDWPTGEKNTGQGSSGFQKICRGSGTPKRWSTLESNPEGWSCQCRANDMIRWGCVWLGEKMCNVSYTAIRFNWNTSLHCTKHKVTFSCQNNKHINGSSSFSITTAPHIRKFNTDSCILVCLCEPDLSVLGNSVSAWRNIFPSTSSLTQIHVQLEMKPYWLTVPQSSYRLSALTHIHAGIQLSQTLFNTFQ